MPDRDGRTSPNARFLAGDIQAARTIRGRLGNALSVSLLTHVGGFLLVAFVMSRLPGSNRPAKITSETLSNVTWIAQDGLGGGGDSGNDRPEPARTTELPGHEALTVPVTKPHKSDPELTRDPPKVEQQLQIPAVVTMAGMRELPGIVSALTPVSITDSQGPGTGGHGGEGQGTGSGPGTGPGLGPGRDGGTGGDAYQAGNLVVSPRLIREIKPGYTPEAMRARIQGMVTLRALVLPDGSVGTAHVVRSLDSTFGLDEEALKTVKLWRFMPGTLAGRAVPVLVEIELTFTLR
jgi:periplasmic protein TonB